MRTLPRRNCYNRASGSGLLAQMHNAASPLVYNATAADAGNPFLLPYYGYNYEATPLLVGVHWDSFVYFNTHTRLDKHTYN